ncbi:hypothetical protein CK203_033503 [Vitis vinifera]|uniref:Uncharacterized protein n=1 Tax=Vitis vinifera TaxID=29760 RepID=A0A438FL75_VITVI|nr:hypothetical protein CK203_033503 [Vitis vinifera]
MGGGSGDAVGSSSQEFKGGVLGQNRRPLRSRQRERRVDANPHSGKKERGLLLGKVGTSEFRAAHGRPGFLHQGYEDRTLGKILAREWEDLLFNARRKQGGMLPTPGCYGSGKEKI